MNASHETHHDVPEWFSASLAFEPQTARIDIDGASIAYRAWGESGEQDIVLVHGGAAHSRWWDHIAPALASDRRVIALDLSGHGDSDFRATYSIEGWGEEILAVANSGGVGQSPIVIGHSLGGLVTLQLASQARPAISGAIVIDSPVSLQTAPTRAQLEPSEFSATRRRFFATAAEVASRFRPVPEQAALPYVREYIAANSARETTEGWTWKFDPRIFDDHGNVPTKLGTMRVPVTFFLAEHGLCTPGAREALDTARIPVIDLPATGHAPMLDQPAALISALRAVLAE